MIVGNNFQINVKTGKGFEPLLVKELTNLGATQVKAGNRVVSCKGNLELLYKINLWSRVAVSVLVPIYYGKITNEKDLYKEVFSLNWPEIFNVEQNFSLSSTVFSKNFSHSKYVALKAKDAIVDKFRAEVGYRPNVERDNPDIKIDIHVSNENLTISLDSSGDPLFKRGYRVGTSVAPMNEVTAAAMVLHTGWDGKSNLENPMCGSGTIAIEAAMIAANMAPQHRRASFSFQEWANYDDVLWREIYTNSILKRRDVECTINASDKNFGAIRIAEQNATSCRVDNIVSFEKADFFDSEGKSGEIVIMNPPYGRRIDVADEFYGKLGTTLKHAYSGCNAYIISSEKEKLKHVGLRPSKKITIFNGGLESLLVKFELYKGTKKNKPQ